MRHRYADDLLFVHQSEEERTLDGDVHTYSIGVRCAQPARCVTAVIGQSRASVATVQPSPPAGRLGMQQFVLITQYQY